MPINEQYRGALDAATREYEQLLKQRTEIDQRLAQLVQTMAGLWRLCGITPSIAFGLTDACRIVLKSAGHPLTAMEVRAQLEAIGFDLTGHSNPLASIHTVLKRLQESGQAGFVPRPFDKPGYAWSGAAPLPAFSHSHQVPARPAPAPRRIRRRRKTSEK